MFSRKLSQKQQQMLSILTNSRCKGLSFLQMYTSQHRNQALNLLKFIQSQTIRQIKEELQVKHDQPRQIQQCKNLCRNFYYANRDYHIKSNKRNMALFGICAFTLLDILCVWVLYKVTTYYFVQDEETTEVIQSSVRSIMAAMGKFIGLFVLGTYSGMGLWYGTGFWIWCLDSFIHRRSQSKQLKAQMEEEIRRHQN